jgi:hypothetical protein
MRKIYILFPVFTLLISSCVTKKKYEASLNSWVGRTESELVTKWGAPSNNYTTEDGLKVLSYSESGIYMNKYGGGTLSCTATFIINAKEKRVIKWTYKGNDCYDF